jgi:hypothetical protein
MANTFQVPSSPAGSAAERVAAHPSGLSDIIDELEHNVSREGADEGVKLGLLVSAVGRRAYGPLLLVLGLFAISPATVVPGMTWLTALLTLLVAGQMAVGMKRPWLPKAFLNLKVPRQALFKGLEAARPWADRIDGVLRPRWQFMAQPPFVIVIALIIMATSLITIPLGLIPFAPLLPGLAVVIFGLGMTAKDGLWLSLGIGAFAGACWLAAPLLF